MKQLTLKACTSCNTLLPDTTDYFYRKCSRPNGSIRLDAKCKTCKNASDGRKDLSSAIKSNVIALVHNKSMKYTPVISKAINKTSSLTIANIEELAKTFALSPNALMNSTIVKQSTTKKCRTCNYSFPLNDSFYYRDNNGSFKTKCIECYLAAKKKVVAGDTVRKNRSDNKIISRQMKIGRKDLDESLIKIQTKINNVKYIISNTSNG